MPLISLVCPPRHDQKTSSLNVCSTYLPVHSTLRSCCRNQTQLKRVNILFSAPQAHLPSSSAGAQPLYLLRVAGCTCGGFTCGDPPPFSMVLALVLSLLSSVAFHPFPLKDRVRALNCGINWNWINPCIVLCVLKVIILVNCRIREINKQTISECEWIRII